MITSRESSSYLENWETFNSLFNLNEDHFSFERLLQDYQHLIAEEKTENDKSRRRRIELKNIIDAYTALKKQYLAIKKYEPQEISGKVMEDASALYHILVANLARDITILAGIHYEDANFSALNIAQTNLAQQQKIFTQYTQRPGSFILALIDKELNNEEKKSKDKCVHPAHTHAAPVEEHQKFYNSSQLLQQCYSLIDAYKKTLFPLNFYGRKRADELKASFSQLGYLYHNQGQILFDNLRDGIADFIFTGKTACDYSFWSYFRSPNRTSSFSTASLRGMFVDHFAPHPSANKEEWLRATYIHTDFKTRAGTLAIVKSQLFFAERKKTLEHPRTPPQQPISSLLSASPQAPTHKR
jgi:hypothetical protein